MGPRLFYSLQSAQNSLTAWLQGTWRWDFGDQDYFSNRHGHLYPTRIEDRRREDMEIVGFNLYEAERIQWRTVDEGEVQ